MLPIAVEALQVWRWLQWRLPADVWMEAQRVLAPVQPSPGNPIVSQALATILRPDTIPEVRVQMLGQMLDIIRTAGLSTPGNVNPR